MELLENKLPTPAFAELSPLAPLPHGRPRKISAAYQILEETEKAIVPLNQGGFKYPWREKNPLLGISLQEKINGLLRVLVERAARCNGLRVRSGEGKRCWLAAEKDLASCFSLFSALAEEGAKVGIYPLPELAEAFCALCERSEEDEACGFPGSRPGRGKFLAQKSVSQERSADFSAFKTTAQKSVSQERSADFSAFKTTAQKSVSQERSYIFLGSTWGGKPRNEELEEEKKDVATPYPRSLPRPLAVKACMTDYHCWFYRPGPDYTISGLDKYGNALFWRRDKESRRVEVKIVNTKGKVSFSEKISGLADESVVLSSNSEIHCRRRLKDGETGKVKTVYSIFYKPGVEAGKNFDVGWKWRDCPVPGISPLFVSPLAVYSLGQEEGEKEGKKTLLLRNGQVDHLVATPTGPCLGAGACGHFLQAGEGGTLLTSLGEILPFRREQLLSALVLGENFFLAYRPGPKISKSTDEDIFNIYYHRIGRKGCVLSLPALTGKSCFLAPGANSNQVKIARRVGDKEMIDMIELDF